MIERIQNAISNISSAEIESSKITENILSISGMNKLFYKLFFGCYCIYCVWGRLRHFNHFVSVLTVF